MKEIEIKMNLKYTLISDKDITLKEAEKIVKNHMRHGVRFEEFNKKKTYEGNRN